MRFWWWLWAPDAPQWKQSLQTLLSVVVFMTVVSGLFIAVSYALHGYVKW
jgi:preprotein translocase subunit SecE